ncbi:carbohydrate esterase family 9 protein [Sporormia fimetaria CBS 119925]|uniref:N-acetylglucosamine-6-phosphate deacetylase n=1 Tax=Sporormia fimetaria CBS 119925 TaxID=1340428 RepID=A0A6A6VBI7_9PLEO|nr:carbohydrate esterase family 9 protein [Sporormia fimetaria CBS 119925]
MSARTPSIIRFTNCLIPQDDSLVPSDLWISAETGKILNGQEILYDTRVGPDLIINLGGRTVSPGFIDVQINGAYGVDFSIIPGDGSQKSDIVMYSKGVKSFNKELVKTGVTSYCPTLTSQRAEVYEKALPILGPSHTRDPTQGAESLGAHCEGPFLSPQKNGCHDRSVLQSPTQGLASLHACYRAHNMQYIKLLTLAPELPGAIETISALRDAHPHFITSIGHSEATYETALDSVRAGATCITHLFNAMAPLHHRNPGIFGLLGTTDTAKPEIQKPFYGLIADGQHLHPTTVKIAASTHPEGAILVTDAMKWAGMQDGVYDWVEGRKVVKKGTLLTLQENGRMAGSAVQMTECLENFIEWTGAGVARGLKAVTETPAKMLGVWGVKGVLKEGADADLCVLDVRQEGGGRVKVVVDQVWKFGHKVFDREEDEDGLRVGL